MATYIERNGDEDAATTSPRSGAAHGSGWDGYKHTDQLRFVIRNGHRILQQRWHCIFLDADGKVQPDQWRDVPLETESQNAEIADKGSGKEATNEK